MMQVNCRHLVLADEKVVEGAITIEGERIVAVNPTFAAGAEVIDGWVVPGFVDTHCHGGAGFDFAGPDRDGVRKAIEYHRNHGSTTIFASTVTESIDDLYVQIDRLKELVDQGELGGIHLEGPFLAPEKKGAHNADLLIDPTPKLVEALIERGGSALKMITLAPERYYGLEAFTAFSSKGIAAAFGHSNADDAVVKQAIDAGASIATHLFNAMRPIHHREPGPVPPLLRDRRVGIELICDGTHLHADVVRMAIDVAGIERVALITDAMSATGQADGEYVLGTLAVHVRDGVARLATADGSLGAIAGSTLTMDKAVEFVVQAGYTIAQASFMASTTPARLHSLEDVGVIEAGRYADLCVLDDEARLRGVMRRGEWVYRK